MLVVSAFVGPRYSLGIYIFNKHSRFSKFMVDNTLRIPEGEKKMEMFFGY